MHRRKHRPYGTGAIVELRHGLAIRYWETYVDAKGATRRVMRYENLGDVTKRQAEATLAERQIAIRKQGPRREVPVPTFREVSERYERDILSMKKASTRKGRTALLDFHLVPRFGSRKVSELTTADIQRYFTELRETGFEAGDRREAYSAHTLHDIRGVLRAVLKFSVECYRQPVDTATGQPFNPVSGVRLPALKPKFRPWALTAEQAGQLIGRLRGKPKVMVALAITSGMRRGEVLALRVRDVAVDETGGKRSGCVTVNQASYLGAVDTPKTEAGIRTIDLHPWVLDLILDWVTRGRKRNPDDFLFGTRNNRLENSNNILRRHVFPACDAIGVPHATWLTFRRTFQTLAHHAGIPARTIADIVGHADVGTQFIYIQPADAMKRVAVDRVGNQLCEIVRDSTNEGFRVH